MPFPLAFSIVFWAFMVLCLIGIATDKSSTDHSADLAALLGFSCFYMLVKIVYLLDPHHFPLR